MILAPRGFQRATLAALGPALLLVCVARGADETPADPHAHHHQMMQAPPPVARRTANYVAPDVALVRSDGARVNFKHELDDGRPVLLDPEQDTPSRLADYAQRYQAGAQWSFYSGTIEASILVQRAFDVYRGEKMNHSAVTLYRAAPGQPWVRLDGFATPDAVLGEVRTPIAQK
jgi:protein SCO1/2